MTPFVTSITNLLSLAIIACDALAVVLLVLLVTPLKRSPRGEAVLRFFGSNALLFSFVVAAGAAGSSLFYSEIAHFTPCLLCWWQRILIYPQVVILAVALVINDARARTYCAVLSAIGTLVALYHTYLQFGGTDLVPCSATGASCNQVYFVTYGYITIPTMALTAFALILLFCLIPTRKSQ
ncbi:MAG TPA: disulfide bond formation protein B [Candidatus Paceibacterota bacterium]|nr:disulfide bond formation protein B [Candidatus Paceibacterota bacterium]